MFFNSQKKLGRIPSFAPHSKIKFLAGSVLLCVNDDNLEIHGAISPGKLDGRVCWRDAI